MSEKDNESTFKQLQAEKFSEEAVNEYLEYESPWLSELSKWHNRKLIELIRPSSSILDVGCGIGDLFGDLLKRTQCVTGCDISPGSLQMANKLNPLAFAVVSDAENLPFRDKCFDAVVLKGALHHFPEIKKSLEEMSRVLIPNGSLIISEPCGDTRFVRFARNVFSKDKEKYFGSEELANLVDPNFDICSCERVSYFSFALGFIFRRQIAMLRKPAELWRKLSKATLILDRAFSLPFLKKHNLGLLMLARKRKA